MTAQKWIGAILLQYRFGDYLETFRLWTLLSNQPRLEPVMREVHKACRKEIMRALMELQAMPEGDALDNAPPEVVKAFIKTGKLELLKPYMESQ